MTLFIDLGYLYCKQMQRAFSVFKKHAKLIENRFSRSKVQKCGNFSQDSGMPGTEGVIAFSQLINEINLILQSPCKSERDYYSLGT
jgi:hypothetical protein